MVEARRQMAERRTRLLRWLSFAPTATVASENSKIDEKCAVCWRVLAGGEPHFILTFKNTFSVRLDARSAGYLLRQPDWLHRTEISNDAGMRWSRPASGGEECGPIKRT